MTAFSGMTTFQPAPPLNRFVRRHFGLRTLEFRVVVPLGSVIAMNQLFRLSSSVKRDPAIDAWMKDHSGELGAIAQQWFDVMRERGSDVREVMHDGCAVACVADAAFAYVNVFKAHVNVGFFRGAELADPAGLLEGSGKYMRHVRLRTESDIDATALRALIETAYADMKSRLKAE
jgi:hypothetical protein